MMHAAPARLTPSVKLREFLDDCDVPCPACGYNLRALRSNACPECGQALELRVNLVEPRMRLWIAGMVGLAAGAGFSTLLVIYGAFAFVLKGVGGPGGWFVITIGGGVVEGGLLVLWAIKRRGIRKLGLGTRGWLVAGCFALTIINFVIFSANIR